MKIDTFKQCLYYIVYTAINKILIRKSRREKNNFEYKAKHIIDVKMGEYMKKKIIESIFMVVLVIIIGIIMSYIFGFQISYNPSLDNNWDALSVCASWTGVFTSLIAIIVAIKVPEKIAKSQNDISLFEKRWELREIVSELKDFGNALSKIKKSDIDELSIITKSRHYLIVFMYSGDRDEEIQKKIGLNIKNIYDEHKQLIGYQIIDCKDSDLDEYERNFITYIGRQKRIIKQYSLLLDRDSEYILTRIADVYYKLMIEILMGSDLKNNDISSFKSNPEFEKYFFDSDSTEKVKNEFLNRIKEMEDKLVFEKIEKYLRIKE